METKLTNLVDKALSRRNFLVGSGTVAAAAVLVGCGDSTSTTTPVTPPATTLTDADYLNFALNLEYLEAEFYLRAATGNGLSSTDAGSGAGTVTGGAQVQFATSAYANYANMIAQDELNHVRLLRAALGSSAVARPNIDLTAGFNAVASAAGIGSTFNAFADENSFLVGAFAFEDVGVTAYTGAAALLTSVANLSAAAGIQAVEAYHAGIIRTIIAGAASVSGASQTYLTAANQISVLRGTLGGGNETTLSINSIVAASSANAIAFARTTDEVLHIVYGAAPAAGVKSGAFFPNGLNGNISVTAS
ncbi:ferritin-like domain-containing protein [Granulicella aggregans]|uniref:ferritin-like domain-containing protein n=1 Tax=Granulicella aggregans TaxID=474949 RepID=UPI0021E06C6C|nr:ferritin-like domain-containing protein [Granulicella aggregans]